MILAVRPDTLSSSVDICFIKPQDLLALSKAIFAWCFIKDKRPSTSEILDKYSVHRQEERGGEEAPESNISAGGDPRPRSIDPLARTGWKPTGRKRKTSQKLYQARHFIKEKYLQRVQAP
jgi:hypothetical protein